MIKKSSQLNDKVVLPKTEGIIEKETKRDEAETNILEAKRRVNLTIETLKATNPLLGRCDRASLVVAILNAQELGLSVDPILGEVYIIPYRNKTDLTYRAQLQIGYRGFIKLAYNTGIFKVIRVSDVRAGEEEKVSDLLNKESGMIDFSLETLKKGIAEYEERRKKPVIGYLAMFELKDGTRELKFMSLEECKD